MHKLSLFVGLALASAAGAQIPLPAFGNTYTSTGGTRGFWFTCPTPCIIQGIAVPNEANQPFQTVEVVDLGTTAPPNYPATVVGTQLFYDNTSAGGSTIPTSIVLQAGNVYGVMGCCNNIQGGGSAYNSYGTPAGPFQSSILGTPVTLTRFGTQSNIATNGGNQPVWQEPAGAISRVELYIVPASGLYADFTATPTAGPVGQSVSFTDTSYSSDPNGVVAWAWDLDGDGVTDSTVQNPTFVYNTCGSYDVGLTVFDSSHPPSTVTKQGYIEIGITPITPSFTYAPLAPGVYQFTDTSTPTPSAWAWDLDGDGITDSTVQNPAWAYSSPCISVDVTLEVSSACAGPWSTSQGIVAAPTSFTTSMAPNNGAGNASGGGNTFDIDVTNPNGVNICALTLTPYTSTAGATITCDVWITDAPGGYASNHTNQAVWRHVASGSGKDTGVSGGPTVFTLSNTVYLPFGRYGMGVSTSQGTRYVTLSTVTTYTGPDFSIIAGNGKAALFGTSANTPRGVCATFHYSVLGNGDMAGFGYFGAGCAGSMGITHLDNDVRPAIGTTMNVALDNLPLNSALIVVGLSNALSPLGALPLSTAAYGAPGCFLRVSPDANLLLLGSANAATWSFSVPFDANLVGILMFSQALVLDSGVNAAGAVASDAHGLMIGF